MRTRATPTDCALRAVRERFRSGKALASLAAIDAGTTQFARVIFKRGEQAIYFILEAASSLKPLETWKLGSV